MPSRTERVISVEGAGDAAATAAVATTRNATQTERLVLRVRSTRVAIVVLSAGVVHGGSQRGDVGIELAQLT